MTTYGTAVGDYTCRAYVAGFLDGTIYNGRRQDGYVAFCF